MFLHKAIKPARVFVNRILSLLREMGDDTRVAISEGAKRDLSWFMACAHAINGTVNIYKCLLPRIEIFVDASLKGVGGVCHSFVYRRALPPNSGWCIAYWEAINVIVALRTFASLVQGHRVLVWCDNTVAVNILNSGRGSDPILNLISRNLWVLQASLDCDVQFMHISGKLNRVADILSRWDSFNNPYAVLYPVLNQVPVWCETPLDCFFLDQDI
jgi:hypothetical protein